MCKRIWMGTAQSLCRLKPQKQPAQGGPLGLLLSLLLPALQLPARNTHIKSSALSGAKDRTEIGRPLIGARASYRNSSSLNAQKVHKLCWKNLGSSYEDLHMAAGSVCAGWQDLGVSETPVLQLLQRQSLLSSRS